jgi:hypothetical protein
MGYANEAIFAQSLQHLNESEEIGDALLFLAKYEMNRLRYREASDYAKVAADFPYPVSGRSF